MVDVYFGLGLFECVVVAMVTNGTLTSVTVTFTQSNPHQLIHSSHQNTFPQSVSSSGSSSDTSSFSWTSAALTHTISLRHTHKHMKTQDGGPVARSARL